MAAHQRDHRRGQAAGYDRPETANPANAAKYGYVEFDRSQYRKEWAQTGDEEYTVAYDATTDAPESASLAAPTQLRWQNGLLYRLSDYRHPYQRAGRAPGRNG